ncbi:hypothetical protein BHE74_00030573, partial [Ensete ventricosum]
VEGSNGSDVEAAVVKSPSVADICRKMATKRSESEGSSDGKGRRGQQQYRLRVWCNFVAAGGIGCSKGAAAIGGRRGSDDVHGCSKEGSNELAKVKSMHRVDAVGNSPGVRRELAEGIGSLLGWCNEVRQKKTETHRKIIGGNRKAYRERFAEGIGMLAGNTPGDRRKKTGRLAARMSEAVGLVGAGRLTRPGPMGKPPVPRYSGG